MKKKFFTIKNLEIDLNDYSGDVIEYKEGIEFRIKKKNGFVPLELKEFFNLRAGKTVHLFTSRESGYVCCYVGKFKKRGCKRKRNNKNTNERGKK